LLFILLFTLILINLNKFERLNKYFKQELFNINSDKSTIPPIKSSKIFINDTIIDSNDNLTQLIFKSKAPSFVIDSLILLNVNYFGFDNKIHKGQVIVNKKCRNSIKTIFVELMKIRFPIYSVKPISLYEWNDSLSMAHNNTSSFNYRTVDGTSKMSDHAYGLAIDINPLLNPYVKENYFSKPINAVYDTTAPGTIHNNSEVVKIFKKHGWKWGGDFYYIKDYQHFYY
jgi:peptidoglycan L-alanyl-D-glutamate endopeptidase CwlK